MVTQQKKNKKLTKLAFRVNTTINRMFTKSLLLTTESFYLNPLHKIYKNMYTANYLHVDCIFNRKLFSAYGILQLSNTGKASVLFVWQVIFQVWIIILQRKFYNFKSVHHSTMHAFIYNRSDTPIAYSFRCNEKYSKPFGSESQKTAGIQKSIRMNNHELNAEIFKIHCRFHTN